MKDTRRKHLLALLASRYGGDRGRFCADAGMTKGRLSQLLDPNEPFGDVAAANLTEKLHLPHGYFDRPLSGLLGPVPGSDGYEVEPASQGLLTSQARFTQQSDLSTEAYNLGKLFDQIPAVDIVKRARAHHAAQSAILDVLLEKKSNGS